MLEVISAGLYSTVQDEGRPHYGHLGVAHAGAADPLALAVANLLVGLQSGAPALEMTLLGASFAVRATCLVGIGGADMEAQVPEEGRLLRPGGAYLVRAGSTLVFGGALDGARTYLSMAGGIAAEEALGSRSTDPVAGFGGIAGRPLREGDLIEPATHGPFMREERRWPAGTPSSGIGISTGDGGCTCRVAVVAGPQLELFSPAAREALAEATWIVTARSDRAGLRLDGPLLGGHAVTDLISQPMLPGAVEVPLGGLPIVLMPDAPTVGGYPVPAVVARVDQPTLGQLRPGDELRFAWCDPAEARVRWSESRSQLRRVAATLA